MSSTALRLLLLPLLATLALLTSAAVAAAHGTISFSSSSYSVQKGQGDAVITVVRSDPRGAAQVRYGAWHVTAQPDIDYRPVGGRIDLSDGQAQGTFTVPIVNDGFAKGPVTVRLGLYGPYPESLGDPSQAILTISDAVPATGARNLLNPLALFPPPTSGNPLRGARFFVDRQWGLASVVAHQVSRAQPGVSHLLDAIASQPEAHRFGRWDPDPRYAVGAYLARAHAADPGAVPLVETYRLKHLSCGGVSDSRSDAAAYKRWYEQFAQGIGNARAVVFYEIDALITTPCLSRRGLQVRTDEMRTAIASLAALPHAVVYVDAGAADAAGPARTARLLRQVGVDKLQGFFVNATHFDWTSSEIRYGEAIVRRLGAHAHFVVNTAVNGRGPLVPHDRVAQGNEVLCNPRGRGLGPQPTGTVPARYRNLDGFFWIGNPGRSGGTCGIGDPPTGSFFLGYALMLIRNADYRIR
ncbi:MAG TPA: glycoside hydrolase family 6 protein [Conexibacter sp.]|jgi:endoglucanase|nr:glycoside hydrolase family 6 protein [Conexibacter sp.]